LDKVPFGAAFGKGITMKMGQINMHNYMKPLLERIGAVFGVAAEMRPETVRRINPIFSGAAYGATVFVAAHEIVVPALKLSSNPLEEPVPEQISGFVSHSNLWHWHGAGV
jgi:hypothetical protein